MHGFLRKFVLSALIASGLPAVAQSDQNIGVMPKEAILNQTIGSAGIQLSMEYQRIVYQLEQTGYRLISDTDPRLANFVAQEPNYCDLSGRAPESLTLNYVRREDGGQTSYALTWSPEFEGRYVLSRILYSMRTERGLSRGEFYLFIPGTVRAQLFEEYCGVRFPTSCNVFSVPEGQPSNVRYADSRIFMSSDDDFVRAERRDLPDLNRVCDR